MPEPVSLIMRQFLAWVPERPRRREEVREAWRSCPRISVWEDAVMEELVAYRGDGMIGLTQRGREVLRSPDEAKRNPGNEISAPRAAQRFHSPDFASLHPDYATPPARVASARSSHRHDKRRAPPSPRLPTR